MGAGFAATGGIGSSTFPKRSINCRASNQVTENDSPTALVFFKLAVMCAGIVLAVRVKTMTPS